MSNSSNQSKSTFIPIAIIASLFFIFGFVTWINGALIPFMKTINELTDAQSYLVASASYISFVVMALPASYIINKIGYRRGMSLGLIVMAIGALLFIPAANARTYWVFLVAIFIQGMGMTLLQTASNPYITILGPIESAAKRIAIMGIANKVAGALGSLIFAGLLLTGIDGIKERLSTITTGEKEVLLNEMASSVVTPYIVMAVVLVILGLLIRNAPLPHVEAEQIEETKGGETAKTSIFQFPHLWLGVLALFLYVGAEVIAADTIIAYGISLGIPTAEAQYFTMYTLFAMVAMYAIGVIFIPKYLKQDLALKISAILGILFTFGIIFTTGFTSVMFVVVLGLANALVWPAVWPLTLEGLGKFTKTASALLIMAISGGAIFPLIYGRLVDTKKIELITQGIEEVTATAEAATSSYWILFPCYIFILYYAMSGHKAGLKNKFMAAKRLLALDVLRGLTIALMIMVNTPGSWSYVYPPLRHAKWNGATPTDLVFPFFLFIVGVSMWFSFKKYGGGITRNALLKVFKRFTVIFLLGLFLNALPNFDFENLRIYGVLQRIAIAYAIAALLCMKFEHKALIRIFVLILLGYWGLIFFLGGENPYSIEDNIVAKVDLFIFGENHIYGGFGLPFDPEGLLSSIPSIATVLMGYFTGRIIEKSGAVIEAIKKLIFYGTIAVVIGLLWNLVYLINKPIWSSSYVVYTGGLAMLFLSLLLWIIDVKGIKKIFNPFIHFGTNPLFIFMLAGVFGRLMRLVKTTNTEGESVSVLNYYYSELLVPIFGNMNGSLFYAISHIVFFWFLTYILYKKKIFIKI